MLVAFIKSNVNRNVSWKKRLPKNEEKTSAYTLIISNNYDGDYYEWEITLDVQASLMSSN